VLSASFVVEEGRTDDRGRLSPEGLLDLFQEGATEDAERRGAGMRGLVEAGLAWVLQRLRVEVEVWPARGLEVAVTTWPTRFGGAMAERAFTVEDAHGQPLARAMSRWAMVDLRARRAVRLPPAVRALPVPARPAPLALDPAPEPSSVLRAGDAGATVTSLGECSFLVQEADLDQVGHANNIRHVGWAFAAVPSDWLERHELRAFEAHFKGAVFRGDPVASRVFSTDTDRLHHALTHGPTQAPVTLLDSWWRPRP